MNLQPARDGAREASEKFAPEVHGAMTVHGAARRILGHSRNPVAEN
jgi:hypothetical protein